MKPPSLVPLFDSADNTLTDGTVIPVSGFCRRMFSKGAACQTHYLSVQSRTAGFSQCPFGFTTRTFHCNGVAYAATGVVAYPRHGSDLERKRAKEHPEVKTTRKAIDSMVSFIAEADSLRADAVQKAARVLPQAFHELRKLNGAILQHAEKELKSGSSAALQTIKSAAELMRNNFDILEALSNIDGMRVLPRDSSINLFDLSYKTKKVLDERASAKQIQINVDGVRALVPGSQKSLPIVPAVLIENAIKYGRRDSSVVVFIDTHGGRAILSVENETEFSIDPQRCFDRGTRYAGAAVEGGGFGLFLAKEIVAAHGGHIRCEPSYSRVKFVVDLPLDRVVPQGR